MAQQIRHTKICPHCKYVYAREVYPAGDADDRMVKFGKIYVTCPQCKHVFRDTDIYELAVMDPPKKYMSRFTVNNVMFAAIFAVCALIAAGSDNLSMVGLFLCGVIFFILMDVFRHWSHSKTVAEERELSIKRIKQDPAYAMMLKAAGFRLPEGVDVAEPSASESAATQGDQPNEGSQIKWIIDPK